MFRRLFYCLIVFLAVGQARAQAPVLSDDNEFSTQTPAEFMTVPPDKDFDQSGLVAARAVVTAALQLDNILTAGPSYQPFSSLFAEAEFRGYVAITRYFTEVFLFDWNNLSKSIGGGSEMAPLIAPDFGPTPLGMVRVPWRAIFDE